MTNLWTTSNIGKKTNMNAKYTEKQLVLIDGNVPEYTHLIDNIPTNSEVIVLDTEKNGIEEITQVLAQQKNLDNIHLISHGNPGTLYLGNTELNNNNFGNYAAKIREWQKALANQANLILYGCSVAAGTIGETFVKQISELLSVNIAASKTLTGDKKLGGNWDLEFTIGKFTSELLFNENNSSNYGHVLSTVQGSQANDYLIGNDDSNTFYGEEGNDIMVGINQNTTASVNDSSSSNSPLHHDVFSGGAGADTFILGEDFQGYYHESGFLDAALIMDFNQGNEPGVYDVNEGDKIQLAGDISKYQVVNLNGVTRIYYVDNDFYDLVAQLNGVELTQEQLDADFQADSNGETTTIFSFDNTLEFAPQAVIGRSQIINAATAGDDLIGSANYADNEAPMERDVLIGGGGAQTFHLGDGSGAFYDQNGHLDSALLLNFTAGEDMIRLYGNADMYDFVVGSSNGVDFTRIFMPGDTQSDFIAQINGVGISDGNSTDIQYIQAA